MVGLESGMTNGSVDMNFFITPWSHSLIMNIIWSVLYAAVVYFIMQSRDSSEAQNIAILAGIGVFSHWVLDIIVHAPDMLLDPFTNTALPTLNLWQTPLVTFILEIILTVIFWGIYYNSIRDPENFDYKPFIGLAALLGFHLFGYVPTFTMDPAIQVEGFIIIHLKSQLFF